MAYRNVATYTKYRCECCEIKELKMSSSAIGHPDVCLCSRFQPRPTWERIPCPVKSSVPKPMINPSIASLPFHCSAKDEKPNFELPIWIKKSKDIVTDCCAFCLGRLLLLAIGWTQRSHRKALCLLCKQ